jgi:hypothetical protein
MDIYNDAAHATAATFAFAQLLSRNFCLLSQALGGPEAVAALPVLDLGNMDTGTDYFDWLEPKDLSAPVMIGVDICRRMFVAIKVKAQAEGKEPCEFVLTLFQRYTNEFGCWAWATREELSCRLCSRLISDDQRPRQRASRRRDLGSFSVNFIFNNEQSLSHGRRVEPQPRPCPGTPVRGGRLCSLQLREAGVLAQTPQRNPHSAVLRHLLRTGQVLVCM